MFSTQVNVKAAHFGARVLKRKPPGGGGTPNRTQMWLFEGVKVDEIDWNFPGTIWTQRQTFSRGIHPPGPPAPWASMQKPHVRVERLLGLVKQQKESDGVTTWQVNKIHRRHLGHLDVDDLNCLLSLLRSLIRSEDDQNSQDLDCLLSLLPMTIEQPRSRLPFLTTTECHQVCPRHLSLLPMTIRTAKIWMPFLTASEADEVCLPRCCRVWSQLKDLKDYWKITAEGNLYWHVSGCDGDLLCSHCRHAQLTQHGCESAGMPAAPCPE